MTMTFESFIFLGVCGALIGVSIVSMIVAISFRPKNKSQKIPGGHFDGRIVVNTIDPEKDVFRLEYNGNLAELPDKPYAIFQIVRED